MNGEERGDDRAAPKRVRPSPQQKKKKQRVRDVPRDIHQMMFAGVEPEEAHVDHVRDPRQRMPVEIERRHRPTNTVERETRLHVRVFSDVDGIVEVEELMCAELEVDDRDEDDENRADCYLGQARAPVLHRDVSLFLPHRFCCSRNVK